MINQSLFRKILLNLASIKNNKIIYKKMKKLKLITTALVILTLLLVSCSKSSSAEDTTPVAKELFLSYKYNGTVYKSVPETVTTLKRTIFGQNGTNPIRNLFLYTPITVTVGSYPIVDNVSDDNAYEASYNDGTNSILGKSGTIKITLSDSQYIEGTFEFSETINNVTNTITEGSFRATK
jgi:hypothetical protein